MSKVIVMYSSRTSNTAILARKLSSVFEDVSTYELVSPGRIAKENEDLASSFFKDDGVDLNNTYAIDVSKTPYPCFFAHINEKKPQDREKYALDYAMKGINLANDDFYKTLSEADLVLLGGWLDKGVYNSESLLLLDKLTNTTLGLFGTLGASLKTDHFRSFEEKLLLRAGRYNKVIGRVFCQGSIDPLLSNLMRGKRSAHSGNEAWERGKEQSQDKAHKALEAVDTFPKEDELREALSIAKGWQDLIFKVKQ